jgi:hypothetical protein
MVCTSGCAPASAGPQTIKLNGNFSSLPNSNEGTFETNLVFAPYACSICAAGGTSTHRGAFICSSGPGIGCPTSYYSGTDTTWFSNRSYATGVTALSLTADPCLLSDDDGTVLLTGSAYIRGGDYGDGARFAVVAR